MFQRKKGQTHPVPRTVTLIHLSLTYQPKISDPITVLRCAREHKHCIRLLSDNFSSDIPQKRQLNDERNKNTWAFFVVAYLPDQLRSDQVGFWVLFMFHLWYLPSGNLLQFAIEATMAQSLTVMISRLKMVIFHINHHFPMVFPSFFPWGSLPLRRCGMSSQLTPRLVQDLSVGPSLAEHLGY